MRWAVALGKPDDRSPSGRPAWSGPTLWPLANISLTNAVRRTGTSWLHADAATDNPHESSHVAVVPSCRTSRQPT